MEESIKKFTKEEKYAIFVLAYQIYEGNVRKASYTGLCFVLQRALASLHPVSNDLCDTLDYYNYNRVFSLLPEFEAKKPTDARAWWWPRLETEPRMRVLNELIEETK